MYKRSLSKSDREKTCFRRVRNTGGIAVEPLRGEAPYDFQINADWWEVYSETYKPLLDGWMKYADPPGFGMNAPRDEEEEEEPDFEGVRCNSNHRFDNAGEGETSKAMQGLDE